jgi:hypothetical protein
MVSGQAVQATPLGTRLPGQVIACPTMAEVVRSGLANHDGAAHSAAARV